MSSNFTVNRICEQCGQVFSAKTTVTRFCSKVCNSKNGKLRLRQKKVPAMDKMLEKVLEINSPGSVSAEFLNIKSAAKLLRSSDKMIYHLIKIGKLNAVNLSKRKTLVFRKDIDRLFELLPTIQEKEIKTPPISECYNMGEAQKKFNISEKGLSELIKRHHLFKFKEGWFSYVSKADLDRIFNS